MVVSSLNKQDGLRCREPAYFMNCVLCKVDREPRHQF